MNPSSCCAPDHPDNPLDALRFESAGETETKRLGWVGVDCCGMYQRCLWLAGYKVTDEAGQEYGRIGQLDDKGWIRANTFGGERDCSYFNSDHPFIQDITDWRDCDGVSDIELINQSNPVRVGDMVLYRNSKGVVHMGLVAVPGTNQDNTWVDNAVWQAGRYPDPVTNWSSFYRRAARLRIGLLYDGQFRIRRLEPR